MDWKLAIKEERAALNRIVALLFALADLAECACSRSRPVRAFVLWILRRAEVVARDLVTGEPEVPSVSMPVSPDGDGPADAMRLASSFRDLACELDRQAKLAFAVQDEAGQAEPEQLGIRSTFDTDDFLNRLHGLAFAFFPRQAVRRIDFPDTS